MGIVTAIASVLILIGAINWGLIGLFDINLVEVLFKRKDSIYIRIIYILIGIAAVYTIIYLIL